VPLTTACSHFRLKDLFAMMLSIMKFYVAQHTVEEDGMADMEGELRKLRRGGKYL
jgi:hypothetical protein